MSKKQDLKIKKLPAKKIKALQKYLSSQNDVVALYLFGSFGTQFQGPFSDIDLGVVFYPGKLPDLRRELSLDAEISMLLESDCVDLVNLNKAILPLRFRAVSEGKILHENDEKALSDFLEETYRLYGDYQVDLKTYYEDFLFSLREEYLNG